MGYIFIVVGFYILWSSISKNRYYVFYSDMFENNTLKKYARLFLFLTSIVSFCIGILILNDMFHYKHPFK